MLIPVGFKCIPSLMRRVLLPAELTPTSSSGEGTFIIIIIINIFATSLSTDPAFMDTHRKIDKTASSFLILTSRMFSSAYRKCYLSSQGRMPGECRERRNIRIYSTRLRRVRK